MLYIFCFLIRIARIKWKMGRLYCTLWEKVQPAVTVVAQEGFKVKGSVSDVTGSFWLV